MCMPGGGDGGAAKKAAEQERLRQERITQGTGSIDQAFAGFNDDFYGGREKAYTDYATPQLQDQYADARKELNFALDRKGLSASTAAADQQKRLEKKYNDYITNIASAAMAYKNQTKSDVEKSRSEVLSQLYATENPASAASAAVSRADLLTAPPTFDPLGSFVFDISTGLQAQDAAGGYTGLANSPLFTGKKRSVTYQSGN